MRNILAGLALIAVAGILLSGCSKPEVWEMSGWYTQLSRYRDTEMRAFSIHLKVFEEEKIRKICDHYLEKYSDEKHYLRLDFFDDRSFTPDYSKGIEITKYQEEHRIAQYFYNPFTSQKTLDIIR